MIYLADILHSQAFELCSTGEKDFNLSYESLTSKEGRELLLKRISEDKNFYQSLGRFDPGVEEDQDHDSTGGGDEMVYYDEIDSSKTIDAVIGDVLKQTPAGSLAEIYTNDDGRLSDESDAEYRGTGANLDKYTGTEFSTCDATGGWMEWNGT